MAIDLPPVTASDLVMATNGDKDLAKLRCFIHGGFPETKPQMPPSIQPYWRVRWVRNMLTEHGGIVYKRDRTVVPKSFRDRKSMFSPNIAADIANTRNHCSSCDAQFPSQLAEPTITPAPPKYPFQHICSHYLSVAGHTFCLVVDRFRTGYRYAQAKVENPSIALASRNP